MNARLSPKVLASRHDGPQPEMSEQKDGALHYLWKSRFGDILIEVKNGLAYVNGQAVEPAEQVENFRPTKPTQPTQPTQSHATGQSQP